MKLGIITAFHGRQALTALWAEHTYRKGLQIYCSVTAGDDVNVNTAERWGMHVARMPNNPVGAKFEQAIRMALADGCEAVMILPSDDFVSDEWIAAYRTQMESGAVYIIPERIGVHDPKRGTYMLRSDGRACGSYGAGRCIAASAVRTVGELWPGGRNAGLDSESHGRMKGAGFTCQAVRTKDIPLTDIKCGENIWGWDRFRSGGHRLSSEDALHMLTPAMAQSIRSLFSPLPR